MTMRQVLTSVFEGFNELRSPARPTGQEAASAVLASQARVKTHRPRSKQELRRALEQLKALCEGEGHPSRKKAPPSQAA
jgi:hypothetical protein